jgi:dihydropteroate synthase
MDSNKSNQEWAAAKVHAVIKRCLTTAAAELIAAATARDMVVKNPGVEPGKTSRRGPR